MERNWLLHSEQKPKDGQKVIYFFDFVGVHRGIYTAEDNCYSSNKGWLIGDVTHWMPDNDQDLPARPFPRLQDSLT